MALTAVFTACGGNKKNQNSNDSENNQNVLTSQVYTVIPGDYFTVAGTTVQSKNTAVVEVVKGNLMRAVATGSTELTATDGKKTVTHKVTVVDLKDVVLSEDYKSVSRKAVNEYIENEIKSLMQNYAEYTEVTDRKDVRDGDKVNISYIGKKDGVAFEGGTGTNDLVIGSGQFIDGFEAGLVGKEVGTTVDLDLTFPDPYPNNPDLAGVPVVFTVTINKISQPEAYTDAFVKKITGYDTIAAFEEHLTKTAVTDLMFEKLSENSDVGTISQSLKNQYYNAYISDMIAYLSSMGMTVTSKEEIVTMMGYTQENFDKMVWETVGSTIENDLIFFGYCQKQGIVLTEKDYNDSLNRYLTLYNCKTVDDLMSQYSLGYEKLYESFLYDKVMNELFEKAEIIEDADDAGSADTAE